MPLAGVVTGRLIQPKWLIFSALLGTAGALNYAAGLNLDMPFWNVSVSRMLQVFWLPFIFIPLSAVQFTGVPPDKNSDASAIINLMRNLGGSWGVSIATMQLQWRGQFHHTRLAEHVTPYNGYGFGVPFGPISQAVQAQATIFSYLDVFTILAVVALAAAPLVLFLSQPSERRPRPWPLSSCRQQCCCWPAAPSAPISSGRTRGRPRPGSARVPPRRDGKPACRWPSRSMPSGGPHSATRC